MERIELKQLITLYILYLFGSQAGFFIGPLAAIAGYSGWVSLIAGYTLGLLIVYPALKLGALNPDRFVVDFGKELLGKWVHSVLIFIVWLYILHLGALTMRELTDFLIQVFLPTTPAWAVMTLLGFCVIMAARSGLEAVFRCGTGFFFIVALALLVAPILVSKELMWPMLNAFVRDWNPPGIWNGVVISTPHVGDLFLVLFIFPSIKNSQKAFKATAAAAYFGLVTVLLYYVVCILLFGPDLTGNLTYPALEVVRYIRVGDFLENLDPVMVSIWMSTVYLKLSLLLYIAILIMSQLVGLKNYRPLSFSTGAIMIGMSARISMNWVELDQFQYRAWPAMSIMVQMIPIIYLLVYKLRRNKLPQFGPN
jgi:spore germination protein KB